MKLPNFLQFSVVWPLISHYFCHLAVKMLRTPEAYFFYHRIFIFYAVRVYNKSTTSIRDKHLRHQP